jgi:hypothetical protein
MGKLLTRSPEEGYGEGIVTVVTGTFIQYWPVLAWQKKLQ